MTTIKFKGIKVSLDPCPCCGGRGLYAGHESSNKMEVKCTKGCGLSMPVDLTEVWDEACKKKSRTMGVWLWAERLALRLAAQRWNRRA
jgi:hypothetical protein